MRAHILALPTFKPGDPRPVNAGYLEWHEWAEVQRKAGIKQQECAMCCKWFCPQDLRDKVYTMNALDRLGDPVTVTAPLCKGCAA